LDGTTFQKIREFQSKKNKKPKRWPYGVLTQATMDALDEATSGAPAAEPAPPAPPEATAAAPAPTPEQPTVPAAAPPESAAPEATGAPAPAATAGTTRPQETPKPKFAELSWIEKGIIHVAAAPALIVGDTAQAMLEATLRGFLVEVKTQAPTRG